MSEMGQSLQIDMPPTRNVRFGPKATELMRHGKTSLRANSGLMHRSKRRASVNLFDDLVGAQQDRCWHFEADRLGRLEIEDKLEFCRLLDRNIAGLAALENLVDENRRAVQGCDKINAITDDRAGLREFLAADRKQSRLVGQRRDCSDVFLKQGIVSNRDRLGAPPSHILE